VLGKYLDIFSDPFFWLMAVIAVFIGFMTYRRYVSGNNGVNEEVEHLSKLLNHYELSYILSENIPANDVSQLFPDSEASQPHIYTYRKVWAENKKGETLEFIARIEYKNASLAAIRWVPSLASTKLTN